MDAVLEKTEKRDITIPIARFDNESAYEIFEDVRRNGTKVVMKGDNSPECVLMSPEEYRRINDEYNDFKLITMALQRLENFDRSKLISQEEFDARCGITEKDLEGWEDVEIDLE